MCTVRPMYYAPPRTKAVLIEICDTKGRCILEQNGTTAVPAIFVNSRVGGSVSSCPELLGVPVRDSWVSVVCMAQALWGEVKTVPRMNEAVAL